MAEIVQVTVPENAQPLRADKAIALLLPEIPSRTLRDAFSKRDVKADGKRIGSAETIFPGQNIQVYLPQKAAEVDIVWQDEEYLLLNKRQGMPSAEENGSAQTAVSRFLGYPVYACHRLDAQTGGLLLMAKSPEKKEEAMEWFAEHKIKKVYRCLVCGRPWQEKAELRAYLLKNEKTAKVTVSDSPRPGALPIVTCYEVLEKGDISRLEVTLITGRTHQIRAHLAHIGHPVLGDDKYGDRALNRLHHARRQQLWSVEIRLPDGRGARIREPF